MIKPFLCVAVLLVVAPAGAQTSVSSITKDVSQGASDVAKGAGDVAKGATDIAKSPLKDLNVDQDTIPPVLADAVKKPYALAGIKTCADITTTVKGLDAVLGRDVDAPLPKGKSSDEATELAMAAGQSAVGSLIPGRGLVRQISGAAAAEKAAKAAVFAGAVRRGYLKGLGLARGCKPPAAPQPASTK